MVRGFPLIHVIPLGYVLPVSARDAGVIMVLPVSNGKEVIRVRTVEISVCGPSSIDLYRELVPNNATV